MREVAGDVWQLRGLPFNAINVYLVHDILVDAGTRHARRRILRQLRGRVVRGHALTHAHPDHQGSSHAVCTELRIPLAVGAGDVEAMERPGVIAERQPPGPVRALSERFWTGPPHPVDIVLREGDTVAGFDVLEVPGHAPGHLAFWRERDRVLILGDVVNGMDVRSGRPGLHEPLAVFTPDPGQNRRSIRRLAALDPAVCLFGHGPPLRERGALARFAAGLRDDGCDSAHTVRG